MKNPESKLDYNDENLVLGKIKLTKVVSVKKTNRIEDVYDLKVANNENYVVTTLGLVHNGGIRAGAVTVALPIWHNDISDFLDMQTEHGDLRLKSYDVFPQVCVPDLFMERDEAKEPWITFCPFEVKKKLGIDMAGLYGKDFNDAYACIEEAFYDGKLKVAKKIDNARDLTKIIMRSQFESGLPYLAFTDTINATNPNKDDGFIPCVNLCLIGETQIEVMSDNNRVPHNIRLDKFTAQFDNYIDPVVKSYDTHTGEAVWSPVSRALLVSETDELIRIESDCGKHTIECTPSHAIYTLNRGWVIAAELLESDELNFIN